MDWLDLLAVHETLKSLLQHHSLKAPIPQCSAFLMVQHSHPYMTTGKIIALTIQSFVGKVMALLFNTLSRFLTAFLLRRKCLLISWLQSPYAVILTRKIKSVTVSTFPHLFAIKWWDQILRSLFFECWVLSQLFPLCSFTFIKRLFSSSFLSAIKMVSSAYLKLLIFLPAILIPACESSSPAFHIIYSAYKLNKQGDNIQPWCTPFLIWNQSIIPCPVLTNAACLPFRLLKRQVRWSSIHISLRIFQFVVIHTVKSFSTFSEAEVDVFLKFPCFFLRSRGCWQFYL